MSVLAEPRPDRCGSPPGMPAKAIGCGSRRCISRALAGPNHAMFFDRGDVFRRRRFGGHGDRNH